jgi:hypothetical protein
VYTSEFKIHTRTRRRGKKRERWAICINEQRANIIIQLSALGGGVFFSSISICRVQHQKEITGALCSAPPDRRGPSVCVCVPIWEYCNFMCCSLAERKINMQIRARRHIFSAALNSLGFVVRKWWISLCARHSFAYAPVLYCTRRICIWENTQQQQHWGSPRIMHLATQIISRYQTNMHVNLMVHWVRPSLLWQFVFILCLLSIWIPRQRGSLEDAARYSQIILDGIKYFFKFI